MFSRHARTAFWPNIPSLVSMAKRPTPRTTSEWMYLDRRNATLDWERAEGIDPRDPQALGKPCMGEHVTATRPPIRIANQAMALYKCRGCQIRLLYVPRYGFTGDYRKATPLRSSATCGEPHNPQTEKIDVGLPEVPPPPPKPKAKPKPKEKSKAKETKTEKEEARESGPDPPVWDEDPGTLKAYRRELWRWMLENGLEDSEEDDDKKGEAKVDNPSSASAAEPTIASEWEAMTKRLAEVSRKRNIPGSGDHSMLPSGAQTPKGSSKGTGKQAGKASGSRR